MYGTVLHLKVAQPNPYEAPGCQETNYPYERIFSLFSALFAASQSSLGNMS